MLKTYTVKILPIHRNIYVSCLLQKQFSDRDSSLLFIEQHYSRHELLLPPSYRRYLYAKRKNRLACRTSQINNQVRAEQSPCGGLCLEQGGPVACASL